MPMQQRKKIQKVLRKHGGARKGAGRKAAGRKPYLVRMKPRTMAVLKQTAKPKTVGEYLDATYAP